MLDFGENKQYAHAETLSNNQKGDSQMALSEVNRIAVSYDTNPFLFFCLLLVQLARFRAIALPHKILNEKLQRIPRRPGEECASHIQSSINHSKARASPFSSSRKDRDSLCILVCDHRCGMQGCAGGHIAIGCVPLPRGRRVRASMLFRGKLHRYKK